LRGGKLLQHGKPRVREERGERAGLRGQRLTVREWTMCGGSLLPERELCGGTGL
jgi:hypothetical protein